MTRLMKRLFWKIMVYCGIHHLFRILNKRKIAILLYHGVVKDCANSTYHTQLSIKKFAWQINYLRKYYNVMSLEEVIRKIKKKEALPSRVAVVTFDDGFENNYSVAYPLLKKHSIPATIFLTTNNIGTKNIPWPEEMYLILKETKKEELNLREYGLGAYDVSTTSLKEDAYNTLLEKYLRKIPAREKNKLLGVIRERLGGIAPDDECRSNFFMLSWEKVIKMYKGGLINFGGHTANHEILSRLSEAEMREEILNSYEAIKKQLNSDPVLFAYPNGRKKDFTDLSKEILKDRNILCGLTTIEGLVCYNNDLYELKRLNAGWDISNSKFKLLISGCMTWLKSLIK